MGSLSVRCISSHPSSLLSRHRKEGRDGRTHTESRCRISREKAAAAGRRPHPPSSTSAAVGDLHGVGDRQARSRARCMDEHVRSRRSSICHESAPRGPQPRRPAPELHPTWLSCSPSRPATSLAPPSLAAGPAPACCPCLQVEREPELEPIRGCAGASLWPAPDLASMKACAEETEAARGKEERQPEDLTRSR
jgi:hypothetical protein